ncbi:hypothetical protein PtA15_14A164 [Puccinia triticina]|uniref:J domain-containing protein n=1 Tax=Puccinia triticina TaxID=208348 RepID=A0ABY7D3N3_9BASI|nr:uncharacterized protein PtA15_14A164 [Puccinia triticina]WAQ91282.1 hypothetical protein PtA15_14A164 [Puccinia triticina]
MADAYRVLNVPSTASSAEIRAAYLELACQHHPCKLSDRPEASTVGSGAPHTQFRAAAEAYALIGDDARRQLYDLVRSSEYRRSAALPPPLPTTPGRSRARSELTIDLRAGLPAELRALLVDVNPVKLFNRVVCQIDQERRAQQTHVPPAAATKPAAGPQPRPRRSPASRFPDESPFARPGHNRKASVSGPAREDGTTASTGSASTSKPPAWNGALKTGILRDESKSQFRGSPGSIGELLSRDHAPAAYHPSSSSEHYSSREPGGLRSRGHSTSSSSYLSASHSTGPSSQRNTRSRRVSFSNDVIESEQLKQAREAVKSFKSDAARAGPCKPLPAPPSSSSASSSSSSSSSAAAARGLVVSSKLGARKPDEFFLDKSLYSDPCSPMASMIPQDILIKPLAIGAPRDPRPPPSYAAGLPCSPHAVVGRNILRGPHPLDREIPRAELFSASSAPTGFLARYRAELLPLPPSLHPHHPHLLHSSHLSTNHADLAFAWADPSSHKFHPRSINNSSRDPN